MLLTRSLFLLSSLLLPVATTAQGGEVGIEGFVVPPLSCFGTVPTQRYDMTATESDLSGISYNPSTKTLFAVNNGARMVYEIEFPNTLVQKWNVSKYTLDLEGISAMGGRDFVITDENPASVITLTLNEDGTVADSTKIFDGLEGAGFEAAGSNLGFEGVAFLKGSNMTEDSFLMVQEGSPARVWRLEGDTIDASTEDLKLESPDQIWSIGGMTRGGDATDEIFIVVKTFLGEGRDGEEYFQKGIFRMDLESGEFTERFGGEVCNMGQPEGLTFWKDDETDKITMLVVGETYEARVYEADIACTDAIGDINSNINMTTCLKPKQSIAACEKTLEVDGCGWLRCDKDVTDHTKICTDDVPGTTDCSESECFAHCVSSNFEAELMNATCTHWAYDETEKECYIFAGCTNEKFDANYTLYAMQDETCERTIEDHPLGCELRRCDKDQSTHNKICTDDEPGVTDCTLDECKGHCETYANFTCTTYAYDTKEKECYIFESCENESFDEDYSTYVMVDETCDKNIDAGGCNQRRCDKDVTPHEKICVDDTPEQQCSMEACEIHCVDKVFDDIGGEAFCTHWAYDDVDRECYLFHGCIAEKYDDDYVLVTQSYGERISLLIDMGADVNVEVDADSDMGGDMDVDAGGDMVDMGGNETAVSQGVDEDESKENGAISGANNIALWTTPLAVAVLVLAALTGGN